MLRRRRRRRLRERGVAMVEMAIVVPLLVLLAFGTIETSYLLMEQNNVRSAAREGARIAATNNITSAQIASLICTGLPDGLRVEASGVSTPPGVTPTGSLGSTGFIEIRGDHQPLLGFMFNGADLYARYDFVVEIRGATPAWWSPGSAGSC